MKKAKKIIGYTVLISFFVFTYGNLIYMFIQDWHSAIYFFGFLIGMFLIMALLIWAFGDVKLFKNKK